MKPEELAKEALESNGKKYTRLVKEVIETIFEKKRFPSSNIEVEGRLAKINPKGEAAIVGDLHGDIESLIYILKDVKFLEKAEKDEDFSMIFLGDYGDRGQYSAEVYYVILKLKLMFPDKIVLMRGNHEGPEDLLAYPHDMPIQYKMRFGSYGTEAYNITRSLFNYMLTAVVVKNRCLLVHGGVPTEASSLDDFAYAHEMHPKTSFLEEILWSDPIEDEGVYPSPRGAGKLFGWNITNRILEALNVKIIIRGHEPCDEGFKINHFGKMLTIFSRKGAPYFNVYASYLHVDLSKEFDSAGQLTPFIRRI